MNLKDKQALVVDNGLFFPLAQRLGRDFAKVYYYTPWEKGAPYIREASLGVGFEKENVYREDNPLALIGTQREPDLWVFPHIAESDLQNHLRAIGKRVWGSGEGQILENDRWLLKELMDKAGLPVTKSREVTGTDELRELLEKEDDLYVKISKWRGDMETYHHIRWANTQIWWSDLCNQLGPLRDKAIFIIESPIKDAIETGTDNLMIHGVPLFPMLIGFEIKNTAYFAKVIHLSDGLSPLMYRPLQVVAEYLKHKHYSNFFSTEMRITDKGECYFTDATCRMPSPPGELQNEIWSNLPEVMFANADGSIKVLPKPVANYGVQLILKSAYAAKHWLEVRFPAEVKNKVKLFSQVRIKDSIFIAPDEYGMEEIGAAIGFGKTLEEAFEDAKKVADKVDGFEVEYDESTFDKAKEQIARGEKLEIRF